LFGLAEFWRGLLAVLSDDTQNAVLHSNDAAFCHLWPIVAMTVLRRIRSHRTTKHRLLCRRLRNALRVCTGKWDFADFSMRRFGESSQPPGSCWGWSSRKFCGWGHSGAGSRAETAFADHSDDFPLQAPGYTVIRMGSPVREVNVIPIAGGDLDLVIEPHLAVMAHPSSKPSLSSLFPAVSDGSDMRRTVRYKRTPGITPHAIGNALGPIYGLLRTK
jgi:hypothetical protein